MKKAKKIPRHIIVFSILLILFNVFDAAATTFLIENNIGYEVNPLMRWLLDQGIGWFWSFKLITSLFAAFFLAKMHVFKMARIGLIFVTFAYGLLFVYYIFGFVWLGFL